MCFCLDISFCPWETSRCIRQREKKRIDSPVLIGRTFESMLDRLSMEGGKGGRAEVAAFYDLRDLHSALLL